MAFLTNQFNPLSISQVSEIFESFDLQNVTDFLYKPKVGEVYVVKSLPKETWKKDGYRWNQYGFTDFPAKDPKFKKFYFQIIINGFNSKEFQKHIFKSLNAELMDVLVVHYIGKEIAVNAEINTGFAEYANENMFVLYNDIANFFSPNKKNSVDRLRRKSILRYIKNFIFENNQLFYKSVDGLKLVPLSFSQVKYIVKEAHESNCSHLNNVDTFAKVSKDYFWKSINADIIRLIKSCEKCSSKSNGDANNKNIWKSIKINLIGPISVNMEEHEYSNKWDYMDCGINTIKIGNGLDNGKKYVFVAIDLASGYLYVELIRDVTSTTISSHLINMIMNLGCPETIIIDQPKHFIAQLNRQIIEMSEFKTEIIPLSSKNEKPLKSEAILTELLSSYIDNDITDWEHRFRSAVYGINTSYDENIMSTPLELFMDRNIMNN